MNPTIQYLSEIRDGLEHVDPTMVSRAIQDLKDKFIPTALIKKDARIDRVRINKATESFSKKDDVGYITNKEVLNNHVDYGRANLPKQAIFYGSIITKHIPQPRVAAYFETSQSVKELNDTDVISETFTLSRWRVLEDIEVIEMIFSDEALKVNEYVKASFDDKMSALNDFQRKEHYIEQSTFFSNEFARNDVGKGQNYKYKITAAYANYLWSRTGLKGITYPSVPTEYKGHNVALLPEVVDKSLKLELVGEFQFNGKNHDNLVTLKRYCKDFGDNDSDFKWIDYDDSQDASFNEG